MFFMFDLEHVKKALSNVSEIYSRAVIL